MCEAEPRNDRRTCPSCGFVVFEEGAYGSGEVCPVCAWKDDAAQLANPCSGGGANDRSLLDSQVAALEKIPLLFCECEGRHRDPAWRPLLPQEVAFHEHYRRAEHWFFKEIRDAEGAYWHSRVPD